MKLWPVWRPDVVHIVTERPLGWSALQAAQALQLPVASHFRTNFHAHCRHHGVAWLRNPIMAFLRRFHNCTASSVISPESAAKPPSSTSRGSGRPRRLSVMSVAGTVIRRSRRKRPTI